MNQCTLFSRHWVTKTVWVPNGGRTSRVIQIKYRTADICLPLNNCGEPTCVAARRLVVVMHVWRSTARTRRSFSPHFGMCNTFSPSPPSNRVSTIPKPKTTTGSCYRFVTWQTLLEKGCHLALESPGCPHPSWTVDTYSMFISQCQVTTCGRKLFRLRQMCWQGCEEPLHSC